MIPSIDRFDLVYRRERVPAPELSSDNGADPYLVVRELTAEERREVAREASIKGQFVYYDLGKVAYFATLTDDIDDIGIGEKYFPSLNFIRNVPSRYDPLILRLANAAMVLSGLKDPDKESDSGEKKKPKI